MSGKNVYKLDNQQSSWIRRVWVRAPAVVFTVETLVCLALLMGTVCYFYPNRSLNSIRSIAADYAIRHGRHQPLEYFLAKLPTVPPAKPYTEDPSPPKAVVPKLKNDNSTEDEDEKVNMYPEWPLLRPTCHVIIQKGDTCEGIVAGYGIYSLKRFKQMNFGIQCDDMIIGKVIYIRRDYPCGGTCTETAC